MSKIIHFKGKSLLLKIKPFKLRNATVVCEGSRLGYAIVNPTDAYNKKLGVKLCKEMLETCPKVFPFNLEELSKNQVKVLVELCINEQRKKSYAGNLSFSIILV